MPSVDCKEIKPMQARLEAQKVSLAAYQAMLGLEMFVRKQSKLEPAPIQPVKMCASSKGRRFSALATSVGTEDPIGDGRKALAVLEPGFRAYPDHPASRTTSFMPATRLSLPEKVCLLPKDMPQSRGLRHTPFTCPATSLRGSACGKRISTPTKLPCAPRSMQKNII
jgi:hypothetical protein